VIEANGKPAEQAFTIPADPKAAPTMVDVQLP
jgi:hypothetical protein